MSVTEIRPEAGPAGVKAVAGTSGAVSSRRLASLDQFRGYTVAGMFLVNFLGGYYVTPALLRHHHTYCSYADTIMPQFLFAVGFAFRLTFGRRASEQGLPAAYRRVARRLLGLTLFAILFYTFTTGATSARWWTERSLWGGLAELAKRSWFQTLLHIAVTSLWILPVIRAGAAVRIAYMILSALAHVALSAWFNFQWVHTSPVGIDGGPLGFLTWCIPALVGTLACDAVVATAGRPLVGKLVAWSVVLMVLGYGLSCLTRLYDVPVGERHPSLDKFAASPVLIPAERLHGRSLGSLLAEPPFVPPPEPPERQLNYWMMSQRSGSLSYTVFAAGLSLAVFLLFYVVCDSLGWRVGVFRTLGINALAAYVLADLVEARVAPFVPKGAPGWHVMAGFAAFFVGTYLLVRLLEWMGIRFRF